MTDTVCNKQSYQYYVYAALGLMVFASESLGLTQRIKSNSMVQLVVGALKPLLGNNKAKHADETPTPGPTFTPVQTV